MCHLLQEDKLASLLKISVTSYIDYGILTPHLLKLKQTFNTTMSYWLLEL